MCVGDGVGSGLLIGVGGGVVVGRRMGGWDGLFDVVGGYEFIGVDVVVW